MKDFVQLKTIMDERGISGDDQNVVKDFLHHFSFRKRQQLLGMLIGFSEELPTFIGILRKKMMLAERFDATQAQEILDRDRERVNNLMKQI